MASAHVAGVAALMKALFPSLTPAEFDALLAGGYLTQDLGDPGWDNQFGWGLIDAHKAVLVAQEGGANGAIPAILSVSPTNLSFGATLTRADVTVQNSGYTADSLTVTGFSAGASWLGVQAVDVDANGLGTYTLVVDRQGLADGAYTSNVTFISSENQTKVRVSMQVGTTAQASDGGYYYVLLLDPDTYEPLGQVDGSGADGTYAYRFSGLASGDTVVIYAGTDPNNDGYICDDGEVCGAYLSLDQPVVITVDADMDNIDFTTDINLSLSTSTQSAAARLPLQREVSKEIVK
jgi:serine protease